MVYSFDLSFKQVETLNTPKHDEIEAQYGTVWFCVVNRQVNSCTHPIQGRFVPLLLVSPFDAMKRQKLLAEIEKELARAWCSEELVLEDGKWRLKEAWHFFVLTFESETSASMAISIV